MAAKWLTTKEAAERMGLSERTVWRLLRAGRIPSTKLGGRRRIAAAALSRAAPSADEASRGGDIPIEEGTIQGNTIKFKSKQQGRGGEVVMTWTGTLKGDEIAFSRQPEGGQAVEFTAKRQK